MGRHVPFVVAGARGLVGSAVITHFKELGYVCEGIVRETSESHGITSCDVLVMAHANPHKWKANADPWWDFGQTVASTARYCHTIKAGCTVFISSVDVYGDVTTQKGTDEVQDQSGAQTHTYGTHKFIAESYVRRFSQSYLILRLPALVGPGLTKNPIYDYFAPDKDVMISPKSRLNIIHVQDVARALASLLDTGVRNEILNIAAIDQLELGTLAEVFGLPLTLQEGADQTIQVYDINTVRAQRYCNLKTSLDAVSRYAADLKVQSR